MLFCSGEPHMKRTLVLVGMALVCMLATGLAARDLRPAGTSHAEMALYDAHLQYYEEIHPALIGPDEWVALCNGERAEIRGGGQ